MTEKSPRAFRTISEAGEELNLPPHVLRFWESKFPALKPMKRAGGRRFYRPEDIDFLKGAKILLYDEGYSIKDVQKLLRDQGPEALVDLGQSARLKAEKASAPSFEVEPEEVPDNVVAIRESENITSEDDEVLELTTDDLDETEDNPGTDFEYTQDMDEDEAAEHLDVEDGETRVETMVPFYRTQNIRSFQAIRGRNDEPGTTWVGENPDDNGDNAVNSAAAESAPEADTGLSEEKREQLTDALARLNSLKDRWATFRKT